ncbi:alpha/beta fold hydrolase [Catenulispora subtropica]|uniref:Alpha/beta fold hydrolase n=1 Tax=Catenulispora subtropica TaxID=450798 RepID=A0ABN2QCP9_9ACTN
MTDIQVHQFTSRDGLDLTYRETGEGRPLVLLHGFSGSYLHWFEHGPAAALAQQGRRVILPDFRGHGDSPQPRDPAAYPPDVLAHDTLALIDHLGLDDQGYDLGGYSLGGRIVIRMLARGARPARAVIGGQGLADMTRAGGGVANHRVLTALAHGDRIEPGTPDAEMAYWFGQSGADPQALLYVLDSLVATPGDTLRRIQTPTLIVVGDEDHGHGTGEELAAALPKGRFTAVAGNHWTALTGSGFANAIAEFLDEPLD